MVLLVLIIPLLISFLKIYRSEGITHRLWLIGIYFFTALLGLIYLYTPCEQTQIYDCGFFSVVFYTICLYFFLLPILKVNVKPQLNDDKRIIKYIVAILIIGASAMYIYTVRTFDIATFAYGWADVKRQYYEVLKGDALTYTAIDARILINLRPILFLSFPLFFYYLSIGNKKMAIVLFVCACASVIEAITRAERQAMIIWMINFVFYFLMFRNKLPKNILSITKKAFYIVGGVFIFILGAITVARYGDGHDGGVLDSLFAYGGAQVHNACYFLENLGGQELWGQLNFPYITKTDTFLEISDLVVADRYLNVFGSIVGSYILDFGYLSLFFSICIAVLFIFLIKNVGRRRPFLQFYFYALFAQVMTYGIFYNKMTSSTEIRTFIAFAIFILLFGSKKKSQVSF